MVRPKATRLRIKPVLPEGPQPPAKACEKQMGVVARRTNGRSKTV